MPPHEEQPPGVLSPSPQFTTTHWSVILTARTTGSPDAAAAMEKLCQAYWYPLYAYVRRRGHEPEDARDLTQSYFLRLLENDYVAQADPAKGKFRSFLLVTLNHFLSDARERERAIKRGGGRTIVSLDAMDAEERFRCEPRDSTTPERLFERRWAMTLLDRAARRVREEFVEAGKEDVFNVLQVFQPGEQTALSYAEAAARLGLGEAAVKTLIHRLRRRHRELVREEVAQTVSSTQEVEEELRQMIAVLSEP